MTSDWRPGRILDLGNVHTKVQLQIFLESGQNPGLLGHTYPDSALPQLFLDPVFTLGFPIDRLKVCKILCVIQICGADAKIDMPCACES